MGLEVRQMVVTATTTTAEADEPKKQIKCGPEQEERQQSAAVRSELIDQLRSLNGDVWYSRRER